MSSGLGRAPKHQRRRIGFRRRRPDDDRHAQEVGNRHRGRLPLRVGYYDFDNDGIRWRTDENEFTLGIRALPRIDAHSSANRNQEYASGGIFNLRTRLYFEGYLTSSTVSRPCTPELVSSELLAFSTVSGISSESRPHRNDDLKPLKAWKSEVLTRMPKTDRSKVSSSTKRLGFIMQ